MLQIIFWVFFFFPLPRWSWTANLITIHVVSVGITMEFQSTMSLSMEVSHPTILTVIPEDKPISIVHRSIKENKFHLRDFCDCPRINIMFQCCTPGLNLFYSRWTILSFSLLASFSCYHFKFLRALRHSRHNSKQRPVSDRYIWYHSNCFLCSVESQKSDTLCQFLDLSKSSLYFFLIVTSYNSITYGNLQKISKPNAKCEDPDETQAIPSCNGHVSIPSGELHLHVLQGVSVWGAGKTLSLTGQMVSYFLE